MDFFCRHTILAARDMEEWMNILFFVAIAAFYAIGSVLKAKASKSAKQKKAAERQGVRPSAKGPVRPAVKKAPPPAAIKKPQYPQPPRRPVARPRPIMRKPILKKAPVPPHPAKPPAMARPLPSVPSLESKLRRLRKLPKEALGELEVGELGLAPEKKEKERPAVEGPLLALDDPDALRRAIIYYEIIGKPVSMRPPGEHLIAM
jgi:hypothetical protein